MELLVSLYGELLATATFALLGLSSIKKNLFAAPKAVLGLYAFVSIAEIYGNVGRVTETTGVAA